MTTAVENFRACREKFHDAVLEFTNKRFAVKQILLCRIPPQDVSTGTRCKLYDLDSVLEKAKASAEGDDYIEAIIRDKTLDQTAPPGDVKDGSPEVGSGGEQQKRKADKITTASPHADAEDEGSDGEPADAEDSDGEPADAEGSDGEHSHDERQKSAADNHEDRDDDRERASKRRKLLTDTSAVARSLMPSVHSLIATLESGNYEEIVACIGGANRRRHTLSSIGINGMMGRSRTDNDAPDDSVTDAYHHDIKQEPEDYDEYRADTEDSESDRTGDESDRVDKDYSQPAATRPDPASELSMVMSEFRCPFCLDTPEFDDWTPLLQHVCEVHFPDGQMRCPYGCEKVFKLPTPYTFCKLKALRIPAILYHFRVMHQVDFPAFYKKFPCKEPGCDIVHVSKTLLRKHVTTAHVVKTGRTESMPRTVPRPSTAPRPRAAPRPSTAPKRRTKKAKLSQSRKKVVRRVQSSQSSAVGGRTRKQKGSADSYHNYCMFLEHRCMICNHDTVFDDWDQLGTHIWVTHFNVIDNGRYVMPCSHAKCLRKFTIPVQDRKKPIQHLKNLLPSIVYHFYCKHNTPFPSYMEVYHCQDDGCTYSHVSMSRLEQHRAGHTVHNPHTELRVMCDLCGKESRNKHFLAVHKAYHCKAVDRSHAQRYQCDECGKDFGSPGSLQAHIKRSHLDISPKYICQYCSKIYISQLDLHEHIFRGHGENLSERPVVTCPHCPYQILSDRKLRMHIKHVHSVQTYTCKTCQQPFNKISAYHRHMETHSDHVYQCELCTYSTKHKTCFVKHQQAQHSDKRFYCNYCKYSSGYRANTIKHMKHCGPKHGQVPQ